MEPTPEQVAENITAILSKYSDGMELLDIIDIVDNLRILIEMTGETGGGRVDSHGNSNPGTQD